MAGVRRVVVPFVDNSALRGSNDADSLVECLAEIADDLSAAGVELHLESHLPSSDFAALLDRVEDPLVRANYDSGNSASLGYDPREEFAAYGDRIGSVHVKDRVRGGGTVALGTGDADIPLVLRLLAERGWDRPLVLQAARGPDGSERETVAEQSRWLREQWHRAAEESWTSS
jgi:hexulose-6-phosphate isomerase